MTIRQPATSPRFDSSPNGLEDQEGGIPTPTPVHNANSKPAETGVEFGKIKNSAVSSSQPTTTDTDGTLISQNKTDEAIEGAATFDASARQNTDAGSEDPFGFEWTYLLVLVPAVLLAVAYAWYRKNSSKTNNLTDPESARGRFKKTDRLLDADQSSRLKVIPTTNFDIDDAFFDSEAKDSDGGSESTIELGLSQEDEQMMFSEGKEAAFDRSLNQADQPEINTAIEPTKDSHEQTPEGSGSSTAGPIWRKKKFTSDSNATSPKTAAEITNNKSDQSDPSFDERERKSVAPKTVAAELTLSDPDSFEFAGEFSSELSESIEQLESPHGDEDQRLAESIRELQQARTEIEKLRASNTALEQEKTELQTQAKKLEKVIKEQADESRSLAEKLEFQANESAELVQQVKTDTKKFVELQKKLTKLDAIQMDLKSAQADLTSARAKLQDSENQNLDLQNQLQNAISDTESLAGLTATCQELELERDDACQRVSELATEVARLQIVADESETLRNESVELSKQIKNAVNEKVLLEQQLSEAGAQAESLEESIQEISELRSQLKLADEAKSQLQRELDASLKESEQSIQRTAEERDQLKQQLSAAGAQAESLEESIQEISELRNRLKLADEAKSQLQRELDASLKESEQSIQRTAEERDQLKSDLEAVVLEKSELEAKLEAEIERATTFEERSAQLDDKIALLNSLEAQIESLTKDLELSRSKEAENLAKSELPSEPVSDRTKTKFTKLYRAYERERRLRKELEINLQQAEEQRDQVANDLRDFKKTLES